MLTDGRTWNIAVYINGKPNVVTFRTTTTAILQEFLYWLVSGGLGVESH